MRCNVTRKDAAAIQQEATNACIAGMTMAVLTGSNKKQIMNLGLQSAGCAVANLAGERLGNAIVESHLTLQQARQAEHLSATQSVSNTRTESVEERAPAAPKPQVSRQAVPAKQTSRQIQRPPLPKRPPPPRPIVAEPNASTRRSGLMGSDFERELNEMKQTNERLVLNMDVANMLAETSGVLREVPRPDNPTLEPSRLLWHAPTRPIERSFPVSNTLQLLATGPLTPLPQVAQTQIFTRRPPPPPPPRRVPPSPPLRHTESISPSLEHRLTTVGTQAQNINILTPMQKSRREKYPVLASFFDGVSEGCQTLDNFFHLGNQYCSIVPNTADKFSVALLLGGRVPRPIINEVRTLYSAYNLHKVSDVNHLFPKGNRHNVSDTLLNRRAIIKLVSERKNFFGTDKWGNDWYAKVRKDGTQSWAQMRGDRVLNAGKNNNPLTFHPETGLSKPIKPGAGK